MGIIILSIVLLAICTSLGIIFILQYFRTYRISTIPHKKALLYLGILFIIIAIFILIFFIILKLTFTPTRVPGYIISSP